MTFKYVSEYYNLMTYKLKFVSFTYMPGIFFAKIEMFLFGA
jgi:hypothetical protein